MKEEKELVNNLLPGEIEVTKKNNEEQEEKKQQENLDTSGEDKTRIQLTPEEFDILHEECDISAEKTADAVNKPTDSKHTEEFKKRLSRTILNDQIDLLSENSEKLEKWRGKEDKKKDDSSSKDDSLSR